MTHPAILDALVAHFGATDAGAKLTVAAIGEPEYYSCLAIWRNPLAAFKILEAQRFLNGRGISSHVDIVGGFQAVWWMMLPKQQSRPVAALP